MRIKPLILLLVIVCASSAMKHKINPHQPHLSSHLRQQLHPRQSIHQQELISKSSEKVPIAAPDANEVEDPSLIQNSEATDDDTNVYEVKEKFDGDFSLSLLDLGTLIVRSGTVIDSLRFVNTDKEAIQIGGDGGDDNAVLLTECVSKIHFLQRDYKGKTVIGLLKVEFLDGTQMGPYGESEDVGEWQSVGEEGLCLQALRGTAETYLENLAEIEKKFEDAILIDDVRDVKQIVVYYRDSIEGIIFHNHVNSSKSIIHGTTSGEVGVFNIGGCISQIHAQYGYVQESLRVLSIQIDDLNPFEIGEGREGGEVIGADDEDTDWIVSGGEKACASKIRGWASSSNVVNIFVPDGLVTAGSLTNLVHIYTSQDIEESRILGGMEAEDDLSAPLESTYSADDYFVDWQFELVDQLWVVSLSQANGVTRYLTPGADTWILHDQSGVDQLLYIEQPTGDGYCLRGGRTGTYLWISKNGKIESRFSCTTRSMVYLD